MKLVIIKIISLMIVLLSLYSCKSEESINESKDLNLFVFKDAKDLKLNELQNKNIVKLQEKEIYSKLSICEVKLSILTKDSIKINLPDLDLNIYVQKIKYVTRDTNKYSWFGEITKMQGTTVLVINEKNVTGSITFNDKLYSIKPLGNGLHVLLEVDQSKFPKEHPPEFEYIKQQQNVFSPDSDTILTEFDIKESKTSHVITVIVAYTDAVNSAVFDINDLIQLAIDETNYSYLRSGVKIELELVHSYEVNYTESGSFNTDLTRFREDGDNRMDEIHDLRNSYNGDVAILIIDNNLSCGLASEILAKESTAFAVVHYDCATGYYSFAHEIGHLQGARHNPEEDNHILPFRYGHGYYYEPHHWRTIMSYQCPTYCTRLCNWSSPYVYYGGKWYLSKNGIGQWSEINDPGLNTIVSNILLADFNADNKADVFTAWGGKWRVSYGGTGSWQIINTSDATTKDILLGDFNGDDTTDVFTTWGGKWHVSYGGTGSWQTINTSGATINDILLGDFNADNKTDVFTTWGGKWRVSYGGTGSWQIINTSGATTNNILLGDFNGDNKTDVFTTWGGKWRVSYGGTGSWQILNTSDATTDNILLGDFNANNKADVFTTWGGKWRVSYGGTGSWQILNTSSATINDILLADFNDDNKDDVFSAWGTRKMGTSEKCNNVRVLNKTANLISSFR